MSFLLFRLYFSHPVVRLHQRLVGDGHWWYFHFSDSGLLSLSRERAKSFFFFCTREVPVQRLASSLPGSLVTSSFSGREEEYATESDADESTWSRADCLRRFGSRFAEPCHGAARAEGGALLPDGGLADWPTKIADARLRAQRLLLVPFSSLMS